MGSITGCLCILFLPILLQSCATVYPPPGARPLGEEKAAEIIAEMRDQDRRVSSFYSRGILRVRNWYGGSEAEIFIVGNRDPLQFKIEITHPWGRPILYILIDRNRLHVLSFEEKRLYVGPYTPRTLARFFPGGMSQHLIWTTLRGYPGVRDFQRMTIGKDNQIILIGRREEVVEIIDLRSGDLVPAGVHFPNQGIRVEFSDYRRTGEVRHAGEVRVRSISEKKQLELKNKRMVFNRDIPEEIFTLNTPPDFETTPMDDPG